MNPFDDQLRKKLDAEKIRVDPGHLEQFSELLEDRYGKQRKPVVWWFMGAFVVLFALVIFYFFQGESGQTEQPGTYAEMPDTGSSEKRKSSETGWPAEQNMGPDLPSSYVELEDHSIGTHSGKRDVSDPAGLRKYASSGHVDIADNDKLGQQFSQKESDPRKDRAALSNPESMERNERIIPGSNRKTSERRESEENLSTTKPSLVGDEVHDILRGAGPGPSRTRNEMGPVARLSAPDLELFSHRILPGKYPLVTNPLMPAIQPVKKWQFGVSAGYGFPSGIQSAGQTSARHFYAGGYLLRRLGDQLNVGMEAGLAYQSGTIDFTKSSTVEQYGFGLRSTVNTLHVKDTYAWSVSVFSQYLIRRHVLEAGIGVSYLYGAKGDISRFVDDDFQDPKEEVLQNIWVETDGLRKMAIQGTIGYGYRVTPSLGVFARVRIPLPGNTFERSQHFLDDDYVVDSKTQKAFPELALRFNLFKL